jgi:hypothetical protein
VVEQWVECLQTASPQLFENARDARAILIPALVKYDLLPSVTEIETLLAAESSPVDRSSGAVHPATPSHNDGSTGSK